MKILITGGAGFIGTHLAQRLCRRHRLVLFDNLRRNSLKAAPELLTHPNVRFVKGDVLNAKALAKAAANADAVIHMAAIAGVSSYYQRPLETLRVNLLGTINALDAAVAAKVKRFIYVSTSEVFGPDARDVHELSEHRLGGVSDKRWVYATSKLAGEQFVMRYGEAHGFACTILRPFNIYGPRQTGEGAISNFCAAAVSGADFTVYGDGSPVRAWCYVSDFIDAVEAVLKNPKTGGQDFNIGNPKEVETTLGLARRMVKLCPKSKIKFKSVSRAEVRARVPLIGKARKFLGFKPKISLDEGLRRTLDWQRTLESAG